jgi:hypothetical protein
LGDGKTPGQSEKRGFKARLWLVRETESAAGDSTRRNVEAFSKYRITPRYLRSDKSFSYSQTVVLSSKELGVTRLNSPTPVFVAPYGADNNHPV